MIAVAFYVALSFANPLAVDVSPKQALTKADIRVKSRIWPDDANRAFGIDIVSEDGDDLHTGTDLLGSSEPVQRTDVFRSVGPGLYAVRVCLYRTDKVFCELAPVEIHP